MADNQDAKPQTSTNQQETSFIARVLGIIEFDGIFVKKDGLGLLERDPVLPPVRHILPLVPLEA